MSIASSVIFPCKYSYSLSLFPAVRHRCADCSQAQIRSFLFIVCLWSSIVSPTGDNHPYFMMTVILA